MFKSYIRILLILCLMISNLAGATTVLRVSGITDANLAQLHSDLLNLESDQLLQRRSYGAPHFNDYTERHMIRRHWDGYSLPGERPPTLFNQCLSKRFGKFPAMLINRPK